MPAGNPAIISRSMAAQAEQIGLMAANANLIAKAWNMHADGISNLEIARQLGLNKNTITKYVKTARLVFAIGPALKSESKKIEETST